jgi:predicted Zn-dependent protease with MMP-like domain
MALQRVCQAMERERRGSIVGALVLAFVGVCVASPIAAVLAAREHWAFGMGLLAIWLVLLLPAYGLTAWMGRDAERLLDRITERRRRVAEVENQLARMPLPFECDPETFAAIVEQELHQLPTWVRTAIQQTGTRIEVADTLEGGPLVLGLFSRRPATGPALVGGGSTVDTITAITLYRIPLIRAAGSAEWLATQVRETLLHEVGHLLGMDEHDLDRYSIGNQPLPDATYVRPRS